MNPMIDRITIEDIYKKEPFLYLVGDTYYYLGDGICLECLSKGELDWLKRFNESVDGYREGLLNLENLDREIIESIDFWFSKIVTSGRNKRKDNKHSEQQNKMKRLIESCVEDEKKALLEQLRIVCATSIYLLKQLK